MGSNRQKQKTDLLKQVRLRAATSIADGCFGTLADFIRGSVHGAEMRSLRFKQSLKRGGTLYRAGKFLYCKRRRHKCLLLFCTEFSVPFFRWIFASPDRYLGRIKGIVGILPLNKMDFPDFEDGEKRFALAAASRRKFREKSLSERFAKVIAVL